jgi:FkbM family methyltransferase
VPRSYEPFTSESRRHSPVHNTERLCIRLRHTKWLSEADWLWDRVRAPYQQLIQRCARRGLERRINGTDTVRVLPEFRAVSETYEPEVWRRVMAEARAGDTIVDVGAFIGLYSVAVARRVGSQGKVVAFEPDTANFAALESHSRLNGVINAELVQAAVGNQDGVIAFEPGRASESRVSHCRTDYVVPCVQLDTVFDRRRIDVLKIDVEGSEEAVLCGAARLLRDQYRRPRMIFIEVHPYAWPALGTSSDSLLDCLTSAGYTVSDVNSQPIATLDTYGEIIAQCSARESDVRMKDRLEFSHHSV